MFSLQQRCRACGFGPPVVAENIKIGSAKDRLIPVLDLGVQPLANNFVKENEPHAGYAPLEVLFCPRCTLAQLSVVIDPKILYNRYSYVTSASKTMQAHFARLVSDIKAQEPGRRLFEIGSNDGRALCYFRDNGFEVSGIDPAENLCALAEDSGLKVQRGFWGEDPVSLPEPPNVILARHVFCHCPNWQSSIAALDSIADENTLVCIEVPWALDLLNMVAWDTIYHEHLSYFTIRAMDHLLGETQWHIHHIIEYPVHGGAIMLMLRHDKYCGVVHHAAVDPFIAREKITADSWGDLDQSFRGLVSRVKDYVHEFRCQGKRVVAYGASAKCTVWMNVCGFTKDDIEFVTDTTPQKLWRNVPGTNIPIVDEGALTRELPDYCLMTAWNYAAEILEKESFARSKGVKFIVPIPQLRIV